MKNLAISNDLGQNKSSREGVASTSHGSNRHAHYEDAHMADKSLYNDSTPQGNSEQNSTWQPIGDLVAKLLGGKK